MPDKVTQLHKLAGVAIDGGADRESLVRVVDLIRDAIGAERVFLVYSEDSDSLTCGDSKSGDDLGINQMGLWLIGHQIEITDGPVAFNIEDARVSDIAPAREAENRTYQGFSVASNGSTSEMLIIRPSAGRKPDAALFAFVEAAVPTVMLVLDRVLGVARANRQRDQMLALANAAELLIQAEHIEPVLEDLATAISRSSGYDLVTIDIFDAESQSFTVGVINRAPQVATSLGNTWKKMQYTGGLYPETVLRAAIAQRQPVVFADLQNDERIPESGHEFFRRSHIYSAGQFPITFHDEFLGVLRVGSQRPRGFPQREIDNISGFAAQLAVALEAVQMYKSLAESERQLKRYAEELQASMEVQHRLARTDPLTGTPNRRYVDEITRGECSRATRHKTPLSVVLVDIDQFKEVNDTFGHKAGDEALIQLADLARRSCRRGDLVGRYGGDEFLFVLPKADLAAAVKFADRFRVNIANHVFCLSPSANTRMNVSAGVAQLDVSSAQKPAALIKQADDALYRAKAEGRNKTTAAPFEKRAA